MKTGRIPASTIARSAASLKSRGSRMRLLMKTNCFAMTFSLLRRKVSGTRASEVTLAEDADVVRLVAGDDVGERAHA